MAPSVAELHLQELPDQLQQVQAGPSALARDTTGAAQLPPSYRGTENGTYRASVNALAERLARLIDGLPQGRAMVAFDGPDAAGKTTLASAVAEQLARPALCASADGWHNPRDVRLRRGAESPDGYYGDSFDLSALQRDLLTPFGSGAPDVRPARYDHQHEQSVQERTAVAPNAALLFDGVFLLRPELASTWDLAVYLHVPEEVTLDRAVVRDRHLFVDEAAVRHRYDRRYLPGQALYRDDAKPQEVADVLIDNTDWSDPVVLRWPSDRSGGPVAATTS